MTDRTTDSSPRVYARAVGILFLVLLVCGRFSMMYVPFTLAVPGDAATTASNIAASEPLFRAGIASGLVIVLTEVMLAGLLYVLFQPVSRTLSLVAVFGRIVGLAALIAELPFMFWLLFKGIDVEQWHASGRQPIVA